MRRYIYPRTAPARIAQPTRPDIRFRAPTTREDSTVGFLARTGPLALLFAGLLAGRATSADRIDFTRDVRPILSDNCSPCHGPDEKQRKAKLRLDTRDGARAVLAAGRPHESELFARISTDDPARLMPPKKSGKTLKPE